MKTDTHNDTIDDQLRLLGQLVGTEDVHGRQDMRNIVKRERARVAALLAALKLALPVCHDAEQTAGLTDYGGGATPHAVADKACCAIRAAIARAEGRADV